MATRQRGTSGRSKKTPPPLAGEALDDEHSAQSSTEAEADRSSGADESTQITRRSLERREIPSFSDDRAQRIAERAYWRAEQRGFTPGRELDDWLEAEREYDASRDQPQDGRTG